MKVILWGDFSDQHILYSFQTLCPNYGTTLAMGPCLKYFGSNPPRAMSKAYIVLEAFLDLTDQKPTRNQDFC